MKKQYIETITLLVSVIPVYLAFKRVSLDIVDVIFLGVVGFFILILVVYEFLSTRFAEQQDLVKQTREAQIFLKRKFEDLEQEMAFTRKLNSLEKQVERLKVLSEKRGAIDPRIVILIIVVILVLLYMKHLGIFDSLF